jgi:hypothetical protein
MQALAVCNLCGGLGFVNFYSPEGDPEDDFKDTQRCPTCLGHGTLESWRQPATGAHDHEGWMGGVD